VSGGLLESDTAVWLALSSNSHKYAENG